ncbi:MAG: ribulose-phosphate 3-epimerase [Rikenellaceae bacterium]
MTKILSPSILSADFGNLARDTQMIDRSAAEWLHFDVMDGVFVPNISYGFPVLSAVVKESKKFMDVHLMIVEPEKYVERFVKSGASLVTFHIEATNKVDETIEIIRSNGAKVGISIKPATSIDVLEPYLDKIDLVLVMSVEPGFGGQSFIEGSWQKVRDLRALIDSRGLKTMIEIDGGVSENNAKELYEAGCDVLVAGSAVFGAKDPEQAILNMLQE